MPGVNYTSFADVDQFNQQRAVEQRQGFLRAAASRQNKDTFLSHSSKDNALVPYAINILQNHGAKVYVDLGDERLPTNPSVETAQVLREAVTGTRKFVLLVTPNSKGSNWIPWELGLADGQKGEPSVALFPFVTLVGETRWVDQEYLGLYRRIVWGGIQGRDKDVWMVYNHHKHTATELSEWLRG